MTNDERRQIALFRYGLIAPILVGGVSNKAEYIRSIAAKVHDVPVYGKREFSPKTINSWLYTYKHHGFDGLMPSLRNDKGNSRSISKKVQLEIIELRKNYINLNVSPFYDLLIDKGIILKNDFSYSTLHRFLKRHDLIKDRLPDPHIRQRFEHVEVGFLWQGDVYHGPYINTGSKKIKSYLIAFIDDASRRITGARFMPSEKSTALREVFKDALLSCGKPKMLYVDNGSVYRSEFLQVACAELGIALVHTKPYDPKSKGKIERFFKTVNESFVPLLKKEDLVSFDVLNAQFELWLHNKYHHKVHSSLGTTPMKFFIDQADKIPFLSDPKIIDEAFLLRASRKVKGDGTISLDGFFYEAPPVYIGKKIEVRFHPEDKDRLFIYEDNKRITAIAKANLNANAHAKRSTSFKYSDGGGDLGV